MPAQDWERVHFLGNVDYKAFLGVIAVSTVNVYLTYPFVLSWSMLEAMSVGCAVIASRTPPVEEVIEAGANGVLVDFFSPAELAAEVCRALDNPRALEKLRQAAR